MATRTSAQRTIVKKAVNYNRDHTEPESESVEMLLHRAIEHNQIIQLVAELMKQRAWDDNKNYVAAVNDLDKIIEETRESSSLLHQARNVMIGRKNGSRSSVRK